MRADRLRVSAEPGRLPEPVITIGPGGTTSLNGAVRMFDRPQRPIRRVAKIDHDPGRRPRRSPTAACSALTGPFCPPRGSDRERSWSIGRSANCLTLRRDVIASQVSMLDWLSVVCGSAADHRTVGYFFRVVDRERAVLATVFCACV